MHFDTVLHVKTADIVAMTREYCAHAVTVELVSDELGCDAGGLMNFESGAIPKPCFCR